jgi:hypothetical protein
VGKAINVPLFKVLYNQCLRLCLFWVMAACGKKMPPSTGAAMVARQGIVNIPSYWASIA